MHLNTQQRHIYSNTQNELMTYNKTFGVAYNLKYHCGVRQRILGSRCNQCMTMDATIYYNPVNKPFSSHRSTVTWQPYTLFLACSSTRKGKNPYNLPKSQYAKIDGWQTQGWITRHDRVDRVFLFTVAETHTHAVLLIQRVCEWEEKALRLKVSASLMFYHSCTIITLLGYYCGNPYSKPSTDFAHNIT